MILHITTKKAWQEALNKGVYKADSLDKEGFIHCSLKHQIVKVANYNFKGQQGLVLLSIDEELLNSSVQHEDLYDLGENYPHIYGPINIDAVVATYDFPPMDDGTFALPKQLHKE